MTGTASTATPKLCGFCPSGDHELCQGTYQNGANAESGPTWTCPCAAAGHTLGAPARTVTVVRADPAILAGIRAERQERAEAAVLAAAGARVVREANRAESRAARPAAAAAPVSAPRDPAERARARSHAAAEGLACECDECGYDFGKSQKHRTCRNAKACARRAAARDAARVAA